MGQKVKKIKLKDEDLDKLPFGENYIYLFGHLLLRN